MNKSCALKHIKRDIKDRSPMIAVIIIFFAPWIIACIVDGIFNVWYFKVTYLAIMVCMILYMWYCDLVDYIRYLRVVCDD